jgi:hypothetical protein
MAGRLASLASVGSQRNWRRASTTAGTNSPPGSEARSALVGSRLSGPVAAGSVRGVSLMRVRHGRIVEALAYSKSPGQSAPLPE